MRNDHASRFQQVRSYFGALLFCALVLCVSIDTITLSEMIQWVLAPVVGQAHNQEEKPPEDDEMLHTAARHSRHGHRRASPPGPKQSVRSSQPSISLRLKPNTAMPAMGEHAHRNGFGAPLLC